MNAQQLQGVLTSIENTKMHYAKIQIAEHPSFTDFDRYIVIYAFNSNLRNEYTTLSYDQIGVNKVTGEAFVMPLQKPEFKIDALTWSYLRDANQKVVKVNGEPIKVNSHKYLKWLLDTQSVTLMQLIGMHTSQFVHDNIEQLNKTNQDRIDI